MKKLIFAVAYGLCILPSFSMAPKINWEKAIDKEVAKHGAQYESHLIALFKKQNVSYPPKKISFLAFKKERKIELWAQETEESWSHIHDYPLTAFSGKLGPKLKENDYQIPEGIYKLVSFNPFSSMHLSMMINYPNAYDRFIAKKERRKKLGNNIFLHGKAESVGCLAVGNKAIDQLFLLVRRVGLQNTTVIIAPNDLRKGNAATNMKRQPRWVSHLYAKITKALKAYS